MEYRITEEIEKETLVKLLSAKDTLIDQLQTQLKQQSEQNIRLLADKDHVIDCQGKTIESKENTIRNRDGTILAQNGLIEQQRITISNDVKEIKKKFNPEAYNQSRTQTYKVCLKYMGNGKGLLTEEIVTLFRKDYPNAPYVNVQRRLYEIGTPKFGSLLFRHSDSDGKTHRLLNLKLTAKDLSHLDDSFSEDKS